MGSKRAYRRIGRGTQSLFPSLNSRIQTPAVTCPTYLPSSRLSATAAYFSTARPRDRHSGLAVCHQGTRSSRRPTTKGVCMVGQPGSCPETSVLPASQRAHSVQHFVLHQIRLLSTGGDFPTALENPTKFLTPIRKSGDDSVDRPRLRRPQREGSEYALPVALAPAPTPPA